MFSNSPGQAGRIPIAEIPSWYAGHTISFDIFDPGDGTSSRDVSLQLLAPPGSDPTTAATPIPAVGIASSCHYNATPSVARGPATPSTSRPIARSSPTWVPRAPTSNGTWLRIDVTLDPAYTCVDDCTWRIVNPVNASFPTDRVTWSVTANP